MNTVRRVWHAAYPWLGFVAVGGMVFFTNIAPRAFGEVHGDLFGGVLGFSGLLVTILLAMLAVLVSLDQKPIVQALRNGPYYRQLVNMALEGVIVFLALAVAAIVGFFFQSTDGPLSQKAVAATACALMALGILETVRFSLHLVRVMLASDKPPPTRPQVDPESTPEAAARRNKLGDDTPPESSPSTTRSVPAFTS